MTDAGLPIHDTLTDVALNTQNKQLRVIYSNIGRGIDSGKSLSDGVTEYKESFGQISLAMIKLGEKTGNLAKSLLKLSDILENIRDNSAKFKKAIRYPLITLGAMGIAFTVLILVVVPRFREIFKQLKADLPLPTKILLGIQDIMSNYGLYLLVVFIVGIYWGIYMYKNNENFKFKVDTILIDKRFYLINKVIFFSTMYRYTLVLGELIKSGVPVSDALTTTVNMVDNAAIRKKLETVNVNIGRGVSLSEAFKETGLFESMLLQMIKAGEAGGQLDNMLGKVTDYYNMRFQNILDNLSAYIEPIMMLFIACLVLLMALGIFMPMWDLGKAVNG